MGVHGLWRLLDPSGKPVPLETLEGKVLAIDVSIWIHQVLQGYQDRRGNAVPNAHLLGLFHRICKLLYFKIKPVFVFDGGVPMLKKNTIASRKKQKAIAATKAQQMKNDLIQNLIKHTAVKGVLALGNGEKPSTSSQESSNSKNSNSAPDMFKLPSMPNQNESLSDELMDDYEDYDSETSVELSPRKQSRWIGNIHSVDVTSADFKALPADVRYDVLTDLKETRKQNSWGRLHEMPNESHQFSDFQMKRLLKRRRVQESLESAEKEMGGKTLTLEELEQLLTEQGIETSGRDKVYRIAADSTTRVIFINDPKGLKKSLSTSEENGGQSSSQASGSSDPRVSPNLDNEDLSMTTPTKSLIADINEYDLDSDWDSDNEIVIPANSVKPSSIQPKKYFGKQRVNSALAYMLQHAGIPQDEILALVDPSNEKSFISDKPTDNNETSIKRTALFRSPEKELENDTESNNEASLSKSNSDFDNLLHQTQEVCDIKSVEQSNAISIKRTALFRSPEMESANDTESNNVPSLSKSNSNFDDLLFQTQEVCDTESFEKSNTEIRPIDHLQFELGENDNSFETKPPSSDSDTDSDLVEISDVPIPETSSGLEILVKSDEMLKDEDDIFADVFGKDSQNISDISNNDISSVDAPSTSFQNNEETSSTKEIEVTTVVQDSRESNISAEIFIESDKSATDTPIPVSTNFHSVASTSRAEQLSERVAIFKPELLKANQEKLVSMQAQLETEHSDLTENIGKLERQATAVTDQMRTEAQELLRLFGIPYIVAPMEAEAQCAYLESIELTDGTVTDDSDIWLFGGRCVYKNFFNNNKRVMQYKSNDIEHHFKLTRQQMIQLALLVGSDYTVGVAGIGPVTALEILAAFPTEGDDILRGLGNFCSWLRNGRSAGPGRTTLRNKLRNVEIERGFPSQAVSQAYLFPTVDESKEEFTWSKPNLTLLADYTRQKFGWTKLKFEETISPVVKKLAEYKSQKGITSYFTVNTVPKSIEMTMSRRVQKAVQRLGNVAEVDNNDVEESEMSGKRKVMKKRKGKVTKKKEDPADLIISMTESLEGGNTNKADDNAVGTRVLLSPIESEVDKGSAAGISTQRNGKKIDEYIPQRERDKANALKKKLRAIEVFRKSKRGPGRTKKVRRPTSNIKKEAELSESSDSS